jgi:hypothetical protein
VNAFPIIQKYRIPVTLYLATSFIGTKSNFPFDRDLSSELKEESKPLNWTQIKELADSNLVTIGSHTHTHRYFHSLDRDEVEKEINESKACIEKNVGRPARHFCYPKNISTEEGENIVKKCFQTAVIGKRKKNIGGINHYRLKRIPVQKSDNFFLFKANIKGYTSLGLLDRVSSIAKKRVN